MKLKHTKIGDFTFYDHRKFVYSQMSIPSFELQTSSTIDKNVVTNLCNFHTLFRWNTSLAFLEQSSDEVSDVATGNWNMLDATAYNVAIGHRNNVCHTVTTEKINENSNLTKIALVLILFFGER